MDVFAFIIAPLISAASGLGGVGIGGWIASHNQKQERRQRFLREQLTEFYAPLLGRRERLRAGAEIRLKVRDAAGASQRTDRTSNLNYTCDQPMRIFSNLLLWMVCGFRKNEADRRGFTAAGW
jgi:hypothetical protein